jgi:hypothetical protein
MGNKTFLLSIVLTACAAVSAPAATITWAARSTAPARDWDGHPLTGISTFGTPNLSNGALVQFWLAVGDIDDPLMQMSAYESTDWCVDDILLAESHVGFGTFLSDAGTWSQRGDYAVNEGDIVYVRAYNLPKADWGAASLGQRELSIWNSKYDIVFQTVGDVRNPQILYFDDLWLGVPEPSALVLVLPALAIWKLKRGK